MTEQSITPTEDDVKKQLALAKQQRSQACNNEINEVLTKYRCQLDVSMILKANRIIPQVGIIALD